MNYKKPRYRSDGHTVGLILEYRHDKRLAAATYFTEAGNIDRVQVYDPDNGVLICTTDGDGRESYDMEELKFYKTSRNKVTGMFEDMSENQQPSKQED